MDEQHMPHAMHWICMLLLKGGVAQQGGSSTDGLE
jgi:hypothetical protein